MRFFDSHIHLARLPEPLEVARMLHERGYKYRAVACEPWEWKAVQDLWKAASAEGWQEGCGIAFGIHPETIEKIQEQDFRDLERLLEAFPDAQVGEAGLDKRYAGYEPGGMQEEFFRRQAELAISLGRNLQIHCVGDYGRIIRVLREAGFDAGLKCAGVKQPRPVFHRFGGDAGIVKAGLSLGALFSIHADSLRKKATQEALALIPREHLLFETDADESFIETLVATRGSGDAITPQDVAVMLEDTLRDVVTRFSPTPQRG